MMKDSLPPGWNGILDPGEKILWQGRPDDSFFVAPGQIILGTFSLLFAGFALFWMIMASQGGGLFWTVGLIHFSIGLWITFKTFYGPTLRRRHTWYTLTDKRAFIATDIPFRGKKLKDYPVTPDSRLELEEGRLDTVWLAREKRDKAQNKPSGIDVGFERIPDGAEVYRLIRDIKRGAA